MRVYVKSQVCGYRGTFLSSRFCGSGFSLPCRSGSDFSLWCGSGSDFSITVDAYPNVTFYTDPDRQQSDATEPSRCNCNSSQLLILHFGADPDPVHQNDVDTSCKSGSTTQLSIGKNVKNVLKSQNFWPRKGENGTVPGFRLLRY